MNIVVIAGVWRVLFADLVRRRAFVSDQKLQTLWLVSISIPNKQSTSSESEASGGGECASSTCVTAGRIRDFHLLERTLAGRTTKKEPNRILRKSSFSKEEKIYVKVSVWGAAK